MYIENLIYETSISEIKKIYEDIKDEIVSRLEYFKLNFNDDYKIFSELVFCLLTPQSKAKICWHAVEEIMSKNLLFKDNISKEELMEKLRGVRFKNRKVEYILRVKNRFIYNGKPRVKKLLNSFSTTWDIREWLVENIDGMGYKEASHFLRNIGFGKDFAILDRHVLKNLRLFGLMESVPKSMTRRNYLEIEEKMRLFSENIGIPMDHLDLVLWYKETGEIFK